MTKQALVDLVQKAEAVMGAAVLQWELDQSKLQELSEALERFKAHARMVYANSQEARNE